MDEIPINQLGKVIRSPRGGMDGWFVRVEPETGGFFVFYMKDPTDRRAEAYDDWVEDEQMLRRRLERFVIDWQEAKGCARSDEQS